MKKSTWNAGKQIDITPPHEILYISPRPFNGSSIFYRVNRAGVVRRTPADFHILRNDTYCFGVIHCVIGGRGSVVFRGREYAVKEGEAFLLPPHEGHEYQSDPSDPMGLCFVEFYGAGTHSMLSHILAHTGPVFGGAFFSEALTQSTSILARLEKEDWLNVNLDVFTMLTALCGGIQSDAPQDEIVRYVDEHFTEELTLTSLAERFGYNPSYFSRKFSMQTGMTLSRYILGRRLSRACYLLITTEMPLEEIAETLGFYDVSHLIQRFRQREGVTPAHYRRQNRGLRGNK